MWCSHCQLDVPGIASKKNHATVCCARCGNATEPPVKFEEPPKLDNWDVAADIQEVEGIIGPLPTPAKNAEGRFHRIDHVGNDLAPNRRPARKKLDKPRRLFVTWLVVALGLMSFAFGGGLLVWSYLSSRPELWAFGLPITIGGQGVLVLGLLLQVDALWQSSKKLTASVQELENEVETLEESLTLVVQGTAGRSFYEHLSSGASPHLLLADLKGQLDMLSTRLEQ